MSDPRELYNQILSAINSGRFPIFCTLRTPRPVPKGPPRWDPAEGQRRAEAIAASLSAEGISAIVCSAFTSINTKRPTAPHFHCLLSREPSAAWCEQFRRAHGPRSVHAVEIGPTPKDAATVAHYIAKQTVAVAVAAPTFARSAQLDDQTPPTASTAFAAPCETGRERRRLQTPRKRTRSASSLWLKSRPVSPSPTPPMQHADLKARPPPRGRAPPRGRPTAATLPPRPCLANWKRTSTAEKRTAAPARAPPVESGPTESRQSRPPSVRPSLC